jgi:hypothetical protein
MGSDQDASHDVTDELRKAEEAGETAEQIDNPQDRAQHEQLFESERDVVTAPSLAMVPTVGLGAVNAICRDGQQLPAQTTK